MGRDTSRVRIPLCVVDWQAGCKLFRTGSVSCRATRRLSFRVQGVFCALSVVLVALLRFPSMFQKTYHKTGGIRLGVVYGSRGETERCQKTYAKHGLIILQPFWL